MLSFERKVYWFLVFRFLFPYVLEPFTYEALLDDYLNFGSSTSGKHGQYAPVYPIFKMRKSKSRLNSERTLSESSTESSIASVGNEDELICVTNESIECLWIKIEIFNFFCFNCDIIV